MNQTHWVYVSSWNEKGGEPGIGLHRFDGATGELAFDRMLDTRLSCNVSRYDPVRNVLYFCNETARHPDFRAGGGGRIVAFQVDRSTGSLAPLGETATLCPNPSFLTLDATGEWMVVSNHSSSAAITRAVRDPDGRWHAETAYDDSIVGLHPVAADGSVGAPVDIVHHEGDGPNPRQAHAHPHSAVMSPSGRLFAVTDKGNDQIRMYGIDREKRRLTLLAEPFACTVGSSPRYCAFHPTKPWFFCNHEMSMEVRSFRYDEDGRLEAISNVSAVDVEKRNEGEADALDGVPGIEVQALQPRRGVEGGKSSGKGTFEQQGFCIDAAGRRLYTVLHGPEQIAVFDIDPGTGVLTRVQNQPVFGVWPRGCSLSPDGRYLLAACLKGGETIVFSVDGNGRLSPTEWRASQSASAWVAFVPVI